MKLSIIALGKKLDSSIEKLLNEYLTRLPKEFQLKWILHEGLKPGKNISQEQIQKKEAELLINLIPEGSFAVALDERGIQFTSQELALKLAEWKIVHKEICFIIGGAYGIHADFLKKCDFCWSLSKLTLPHQLVRVILAEQIYRSWTILSRHPYHK